MTLQKMSRSAANCTPLERPGGPVLQQGTEVNVASDGSLDWNDEAVAGFGVVVAFVHSCTSRTPDEWLAGTGRGSTSTWTRCSS
jgi:DNA polymerase (family 10)